MKAVMLMFDTLTKKYLSPYGNEWVKTPNFERLSKKTLSFDNFYAGSMPCMPARRELHTGRYNFLHRSWGPLEPFDKSVIEVLKDNGIYTHIVTDHSHYWEDGGATYHNRFNTWQGFRGQEGDRWMPHLKDIEIPEQNPLTKSGISFKQHWANRLVQSTEEEMSSVKTVMAGIDFINNHKDIDNWFLQIECFDPHEPFFCPEEYRNLYKDENYKGKYFDWPGYKTVDAEKDSSDIKHIRNQYAALITMCDKYLGKVLDIFDENNLWEDTMLIVNTDHGFLLGEHQWLGKNVQPFYSEIINTPFFIWDPRYKRCGERTMNLAQTIDIPPTLLDFFNVSVDIDMDGKSLTPIIKEDKDIREVALFGVHGGHVNITDGEYVYMKSSATNENTPLYEYTLMPTRMRGYMNDVLNEDIELVDMGRFSNDMKVLKIQGKTYVSPYRFGDLLFNVKEDVEQNNNLISNKELVNKYKEMMIREMVKVGAPEEQYIRLGLDNNELNTI